MEKFYAFSIQISGDDATELKQEVAKAFASTGIALPKDDSWQFEGPPEGAFGFDVGVLGFLDNAWRELVKAPGAVLAMAEGFGVYLKIRPNTVIDYTLPDGTTVKIKANMNQDAILELLKPK